MIDAERRGALVRWTLAIFCFIAWLVVFSYVPWLATVIALAASCAFLVKYTRDFRALPPDAEVLRQLKRREMIVAGAGTAFFGVVLVITVLAVATT